MLLPEKVLSLGSFVAFHPFKNAALSAQRHAASLRRQRTPNLLGLLASLWPCVPPFRNICTK